MQKTGAGPDVLGHATDVYEYTDTKADGSTHQSKVLVERNDGYAMRWETIYKTKDGDALGSSKYELSDINAVAPITMPKECENASSEDSSEDKWLIPDGAQIYGQTYDSFVLITDKSGKELTDFYTTTMKDAGYALESSNDGLEIDGYDVFIQLLFKKEDKTIEVNISEENSLRIVIIYGFGERTN
jgi:hypothetical protein